MTPPRYPSRSWLVLRTFVGVYLAFSVLLLGIAAVHYYTQYRAVRVTLEASEKVNVALARRALLGDIAGVVTDLMVLAREAELFLAQETPEVADAQIARTFAIFVARKRLYDQIRLLDIDGRERVRVNLRGKAAAPVRPGALQDKSGRYYFREAMSLPAGGIYISPLDLNVEQGRIERPLKPMLRFATPLTGADGRRRGILVLNYLGARLLGNFRRAAAHVSDHIQLVDSRGYWLSSPRSDETWGFMLDHGRAFARELPRAWRAILERPEGQFLSPRGLFTFSTVSPVPVADAAGRGSLDAGDRPVRQVQADYFWKIVSRVPPDRLGGTPGRFLAQNAPVYAALLALLALGSWLLARSRVHHRLAEAQGLPTFPGDPNQLRQVFSNLLTNALQAMEGLPPGERELEVVAGLALRPEGTAIRFEVCDRGGGIDAQAAEHLFEPFFTTRTKGTGLGLAIVRRILDRHGGRVRLLPREPRGTCAEVLVPTVPIVEDGGASSVE